MIYAEYTYANGQKTRAEVLNNFFCGGEADQWVVTTADLESMPRTGWIVIMGYKWTSRIIGKSTDHPARVWESIFPHTCTHDDWIPVAPGPSLLEQVWAEIDAAYYKFNNDNTITSDERTQLKGYMRGICTTIRVMMQPRWANDDAVVEEVHRRHVHKQGGDTEYCTPGLGQNRTAPVDNIPANKYTKVNSAPEVLKHTFTEEQIKNIKSARDGGFSAEDLAKMYQVNADLIKSL